jgi:hypothetical protein
MKDFARRGSSAVKTVVAIIVLVLVAGAAWYFTSDVFRTRVDAAARELTYWTPDNIAKDPVNYLNFVEAETKKALQDLKANKIAIAQNRAKLEAMRDEASSKIANGEKAFEELKKLYREATASEAAKAFPVEWRGKSLDDSAMKRQIVSFNKQIEQQKTLRQKVEQGLRQLDAQESKIQDAEAQAQQQLAEVTANRELLKVQSLTDDLQERLVSMRGALQATVSTASESSSVVTLEQLEAESAMTVSDEQFEQIMADN